MGIYIYALEKKQSVIDKINETYQKAGVIMNDIEKPNQELAADWIAYQRKVDEYKDIMNQDIPNLHNQLTEIEFFHPKSTDILNFDKMDDIIIKNSKNGYFQDQSLQDLIATVEQEKVLSLNLINFLKKNTKHLIVFDY